MTPKPIRTATLADELHGIVLMFQADRVAIHQGFIPPALFLEEFRLLETFDKKVRALEADRTALSKENAQMKADRESVARLLDAALEGTEDMTLADKMLSPVGYWRLIKVKEARAIIADLETTSRAKEK